jgi:serine/threonine protein kinase
MVEALLAIGFILLIAGVIIVEYFRRGHRLPVPAAAAERARAAEVADERLKRSTAPTLRLLSEGGPRDVVVRTSPFTIGRQRDNLLVLPNDHVSRRHAELRQEEGRWYVFDVGSSNGVFVNYRRVSGALLRDQDQIVIGPFSLIFTEAAGSLPKETESVHLDEAFLIQDKIGHGGMATVYRARLAAEGRTVAVKVPMLDYIDDERQAVERFLREAAITKKLQHPNIIQVLSHGQLHDGRPYMVMEYLPGGSLRSLMKPNQPLSDDVIRRVGAEVAAALGCAHRQGVVHRDLKPENVLFDERGAARLTDFGIALSQGYARLTRKGLQIGTTHYMSPEQITGKKLTGASDLYALGCLLYELSTGRCPFEGTAMNVMDAHLSTQPEPPRSRNPYLSQEVNAVILQLLAKSPTERPRRAEDVVYALRGEG